MRIGSVGSRSLRQMNVPMEKLDRAGIDALAPAAGPLYTHAVYSPAYRHSSDPERLVSSLFELFVARGGRAIARAGGGTDSRPEGTNAVRTSGEAIRCESIVVAAGTASAGFARQAGEPVPHQAVGGYHAMLRRPGFALETPLLPLDFRFAITPMSAASVLRESMSSAAKRRRSGNRASQSMLAHVGTVLPGVSSDEENRLARFPLLSAGRVADHQPLGPSPRPVLSVRLLVVGHDQRARGREGAFGIGARWEEWHQPRAFLYRPLSSPRSGSAPHGTKAAGHRH